MKMIIFILAMVLSGCGGGGGSSPTPTTTPAPTTTPTPTPGAVYTVSGTISGGTVSGVTITSTPGGVSAVTRKGGKFTLPSLPDGSYVVTPSAGSLTFLPTSTTVLVNGKNISGVDFSNPLPELKVGTLMYPCHPNICEKDLATGSEYPVITSVGYSIHIVPYRKGNKIAYDYGDVINGITVTSVLSPAPVVPYIAKNLGNNCSSVLPEFSVDVTTTGAFAIAIVSCMHPGETSGTEDIFAVKLDGTSDYLRVTNSPGVKNNPVAGSVDSSGMVSALWIEGDVSNDQSKNDTATIMRQIVDTKKQPAIVGTPTVFEKDVVTGDERGLSLNAARTRVAFVKVVDGVHHIFVKELSGGKALDLGPGDNPYWSLEKIGGSTLILCSLDGNSLEGFRKLQAVRPDGTKRWRVSVSAGFQDGGVSLIVFAPPVL